MKNNFITLDGVDGVGKTTVAKLLASKSNYQYYKSPCGFFAQLRKEIDARANPVERYCFYRLATEFDSVKIGELLTSGPVVSDRYITSTAAYHITMDDRIKLIHNDIGLIKPDFTFILGARSEIRDKRILDRAKISSDNQIEQDSSFLDRVANVFMSFNHIYIDTSDITPEDVVVIIKKMIAKGCAT